MKVLMSFVFLFSINHLAYSQNSDPEKLKAAGYTETSCGFLNFSTYNMNISFHPKSETGLCSHTNIAQALQLNDSQRTALIKSIASSRKSGVTDKKLEEFCQKWGKDFNYSSRAENLDKKIKKDFPIGVEAGMKYNFEIDEKNNCIAKRVEGPKYCLRFHIYDTKDFTPDYITSLEYKIGKKGTIIGRPAYMTPDEKLLKKGQLHDSSRTANNASGEALCKSFDQAHAGGKGEFRFTIRGTGMSGFYECACFRGDYIPKEGGSCESEKKDFEEKLSGYSVASGDLSTLKNSFLSLQKASYKQSCVNCKKIKEKVGTLKEELISKGTDPSSHEAFKDITSWAVDMNCMDESDNILTCDDLYKGVKSSDDITPELAKLFKEKNCCPKIKDTFMNSNRPNFYTSGHDCQTPVISSAALSGSDYDILKAFQCVQTCEIKNNPQLKMNLDFKIDNRTPVYPSCAQISEGSAVEYNCLEGNSGCPDSDLVQKVYSDNGPEYKMSRLLTARGLTPKCACLKPDNFKGEPGQYGGSILINCCTPGARKEIGTDLCNPPVKSQQTSSIDPALKEANDLLSTCTNEDDFVVLDKMSTDYLCKDKSKSPAFKAKSAARQ